MRQSRGLFLQLDVWLPFRQTPLVFLVLVFLILFLLAFFLLFLLFGLDSLLFFLLRLFLGFFLFFFFGNLLVGFLDPFFQIRIPAVAV